MKLALVHYSAAPIVGGVERIIEEHARLFTRHGHEAVVFARTGGALPLPDDPAAAFAGFDCVFVHNVMTMPFDLALTQSLAAAARQPGRARYVAWTHDIAAFHPDLAPGADILRTPHAGFEYIAVSDLRAGQLATLGITAPVIPNGLDPARVLGLPLPIARIAEQHSLFDGRHILLHPARLLRRKNIEFSIAVTAALNAADFPAALLITGAEDPHNPASCDYAAQLRAGCAGRGDVIFVSDHCVIGESELAALYTLADALIFPSRSEGFGLPVLEAALHRLPIFCAGIEPLRAIAPAGTTFLPQDTVAAARAIRTALEKDAPLSARKSALLAHAWDTIFTRHIAPLIHRGVA